MYRLSELSRIRTRERERERKRAERERERQRGSREYEIENMYRLSELSRIRKRERERMNDDDDDDDENISSRDASSSYDVSYAVLKDERFWEGMYKYVDFTSILRRFRKIYT